MKKGLFILLLIMVGDHLVGQVNMPVRGSSPDTAYIKVTEVSEGVLNIRFDPRSNVDTIGFQVLRMPSKTFTPVVNIWIRQGETLLVDKDFRVWTSNNGKGKLSYYLVFSNNYGRTYMWISSRVKQEPPKSIEYTPLQGDPPDTAFIKAREVEEGIVNLSFSPQFGVDSVGFQLIFEKRLSPIIYIWEKKNESVLVDENFRVWASRNRKGEHGYYLVFSNKWGRSVKWLPSKIIKEPPRIDSLEER